MSDSTAPSDWTKALDLLARAGDRFAEQMAALGNPVDSADVYATMLGALSDTYLNQIGVTAECPSFAPCTGYFQRLGSPNPDTVYRRAPIDPAGTYRLTGYRGSAADVTLMPFSQVMQSFTPFDLSEVARGEAGQFDVIVCAERPKDHAGDWWKLEPEWASLWLREVSDNWGMDEPARIAIARLDTDSRSRTSSDEDASLLQGLAHRVEGIVAYGIHHADELVDEGYINRLKAVDYGSAGGMPQQWYHEGIFDLANDECLLVEAKMPSSWRYFSWSLTDRMLVTLDWMNAHTSLNSRQGIVDEDGVFRVIVSALDSGAPNWMETMHYGTGVIQCRTIGSDEAPLMNIKVLPLHSVFEALPEGTHRVTPQERMDDLRKRQIRSQLRRLW